MFIPVVNFDQNPLMPTTCGRARRWIRSGKATGFFKKGIFCVRLNQEPSDDKKQQIVIGVDPGSKREGYTVKSAAHTYLNLQATAVQHVRDSVEVRRNMRKSRRFRKTPCRKPRFYRKGRSMPPSTKARWQWKLNVLKIVGKTFPITDIIVEDVGAKSKKGARRWNVAFSPLEVGKKWFYEEGAKIADLHTKKGYETKALRDEVGLKKSSSKLSEKFEAHCVDSWVLANSIVGGHIKPDNTEVSFIGPIRVHRRQLHRLQPKAGKRRPYGSTRSLGFKRGSLVKHPKYGFCYIGGTSKDRVSLHNKKTGKRLCQNAKIEDVRFVSHNTWIINQKG